MKNVLRLILALGLLLPVTSCNDSDKSGEDDSYDPTTELIKDSGPKTIKYINFERSQIITEDGWVVNINGNTAFNMQRESCSGFSRSTAHDKDFRMSVVGAVQFEYDLVAPTTNMGKKRVTATTFNVWRKDCLQPTPSYVVYPDTDRDRYADHEDAFPNDPTKH